MPTQPPRIDFDRFVSDPAGIFDEVKRLNRPILVERAGELYRLERADEQEDVFAGYDPASVQAALRASAGALNGVDRDELLRDLYAEREQNSQGRPV